MADYKGSTAYYASSLVERIIVSEALVALNDSNVILPLCTTKGEAIAETITFPKWNLGSNTLTSADVASHAENDSDAAAKALNSTKLILTPARYDFYVPIYEGSEIRNLEDVNTKVAKLGMNAMGAGIDKTIAALFSSFASANDVGSTATAITVDDFFTCIMNLKQNGTQGTYNAVLSEQQIWGTNGLSNDLVTNSQFGGSPDKQNEMLTNGYVGSLAGLPVYTTREVPASSSGALGAVFGDGALAFGYLDPLVRVEIEHEGKLGRDDVIFRSWFATSIFESTYGCYLTTKAV